MSKISKDTDIQDFRLAELEKNYEKLQADLKKIMENHLPHIQSELIGVKTQINVATALIIGALMLAIALTKVF